MKKKLITIITALTIFFISPVIVTAQQITLSISPPLLEVFIKPGKSVLVAYTVGNLGDPVILTSNILPFEPKDDLGNIKIKDEFEGPIRFSLDNSEIKLDQPFFVKSNTSQQLLLRIRVPEGTPEGDYYYTLFAKSEPSPFQEGISSSRSQIVIGSNILITVTESGKVDIKGKISLFDVLAHFKINLFSHTFKFFDSFDKIPLVFIIDNQGRNLVKPQGEITLKGNFSEKATYDIVPKNILAQSQRLVTATPSAEIEKPINASLILSGFFIGRYDLSTSVNFGDFTPTLYAATSFIALPVKFIIGLLVAMVIGLLIIKRTKS